MSLSLLIFIALNAAAFAATLHFASKHLYRKFDPVSRFMLALGIFVSFIVTACAVLNALGVFNRRNFDFILAAYTGAVFLFGRIKQTDQESQAEHAGARPGAALCLLALMLAVYLPPSEIVVGGQDPSVYVGAAAVLVRNHNVEHHLPTFNLLNPDEREKLLKYLPIPNNCIWMYTAVCMKDDMTGLLHIDFPRGPGYLLAYGWMFESFHAAFAANVVYSLLAVYMFYLFCVPFIGRRWAAAAGVMLAICPAEIWFGRATYSEVCSQFFIFFTILNLHLFSTGSRDKPELSGYPRRRLQYLLLAVWGAGLSMTMRIDQLFVPLAGVLGFAWIGVAILPRLSSADKRRFIVAQALFLVAIALSVMQYLTTSQLYFERIFRMVDVLRNLDWIVSLLLACSLLVWLEPVRVRLQSRIRRAEIALKSELGRSVLLSALAAILTWGFVWRTQMFPKETFSISGYHNAFERTRDESIFHRLAMLTGVPIFALAFWGYVRALRRLSASYGMFVLLFLFLGYSSQLLLNQLNSPQLYWAMRRYIPVVIPGAIFFGLYALSSLKPFSQARANHLLHLAMLGVSAVPLLVLDYPLLRHGEMNGAYKLIDELNLRFDRSKTVFLSDLSRRPHNFTLSFLGGYETVPINGLDDGLAETQKYLPDVIKRIQATGKQVVIASPLENSAAFNTYFKTPIEHVAAPYRRLGEEHDHFPMQIYDLDHGLWFQRQP